MTALRTAELALSSRLQPLERSTNGMASSSFHTRLDSDGASLPYTVWILNIHSQDQVEQVESDQTDGRTNKCTYGRTNSIRASRAES